LVKFPLGVGADGRFWVEGGTRDL